MYRARLALILATVLAVAACGEDADIAPPAEYDDAGRARVSPGDRVGEDAGAELADAAAEVEQDAGTVTGDAAADAGQTVYLSRVYKEVFNELNTGFCVGCHPSDALSIRNVHIDFTYAWTFRDTVLYDHAPKCNGKPYVTPGDPSQSFLWDVLTKQDPGCGVEKMPQGFDTITKDQLELVRTWIEQGAKT